MFSVIVASSIFLIAWNTRSVIQQHFLLFIGIGFGFAVLFNILHLITYTGMGIFPPEYSVNVTSQLFVVSLYLTGGTLLVAPVFLKRRLHTAIAFACYSVLSLVLLGLIFWWRLFPDSYDPISGYTAFERVSHLAFAGLLAAAIVLLEMNRRELATRVLNLTLVALMFLVLSSLVFGFRSGTTSFLDFLGHFFRVLSFYFFYTAMVVTSLVEPYSVLFVKLRTGEQRYRTIYDTAPLAFVIWDRNQRVTGWNKSAERIFGWSEAEVRARNFFDLIIPESARAAVDEVVSALLGGAVQNRSINENLTKSGRIIVCEWNNQVLRDSEGNIEGVISLGLDITDQKNAELALEESSQRIKKFAYFVAHDLKNPAITIYGLSRLLKKKYGKVLDENGRTLIEEVMKTAEQIGSMVDDINMYISTRELPMEIGEVNLQELTQSIRAEFTRELESRQITFLEPERLPVIRTERRLLQRVLRNLVDNAVKHGGEQLSEICIGYRETDDLHIVFVRDNGIGLKKEDLQAVFGPFVRKTSQRIAGTGLGLAIAREFAVRLGGEAWAESEYGKGATFYISLAKHPPE
jgi:PAS domain S-box-containing protein